MVPCNLPSDYLPSLPLGIIFVMCICALFLSLVLDIRLPEAGTVSLIILSIVIHEYSLIVGKNALSDRSQEGGACSPWINDRPLCAVTDASPDTFLSIKYKKKIGPQCTKHVFVYVKIKPL